MTGGAILPIGAFPNPSGLYISLKGLVDSNREVLLVDRGGGLDRYWVIDKENPIGPPSHHP